MNVKEELNKNKALSTRRAGIKIERSSFCFMHVRYFIKIVFMFCICMEIMHILKEYFNETPLFPICFSHTVVVHP